MPRKRAAPTSRAIRRVHPAVRARTLEMVERVDVARERVRVSPSPGTHAPGDADLRGGSSSRRASIPGHPTPRRSQPPQPPADASRHRPLPTPSVSSTPSPPRRELTSVLPSPRPSRRQTGSQASGGQVQQQAHGEEQEERDSRVRRRPLRRRGSRAHHPRLSRRGAEDREEGSQDAGWQEVSDAQRHVPGMGTSSSVGVFGEP